VEKFKSRPRSARLQTESEESAHQETVKKSEHNKKGFVSGAGRRRGGLALKRNLFLLCSLFFTHSSQTTIPSFAVIPFLRSIGHDIFAKLFDGDI